ncbi:hypothetical protein BpHYR1_024096, partial [Brachionus plicatilis]
LNNCFKIHSYKNNTQDIQIIVLEQDKDKKNLKKRCMQIATCSLPLTTTTGGRQNIERQNVEFYPKYRKTKYRIVLYTIFFSTFFFQVNSILSNKKSFSTFCLSIFCHTATTTTARRRELTIERRSFKLKLKANIDLQKNLILSVYYFIKTVHTIEIINNLCLKILFAIRKKSAK